MRRGIGRVVVDDYNRDGAGDRFEHRAEERFFARPEDQVRGDARKAHPLATRLKELATPNSRTKARVIVPMVKGREPVADAIDHDKNSAAEISPFEYGGLTNIVASHGQGASGKIDRIRSCGVLVHSAGGRRPVTDFTESRRYAVLRRIARQHKVGVER